MFEIANIEQDKIGIVYCQKLLDNFRDDYFYGININFINHIIIIIILNFF